MPYCRNCGAHIPDGSTFCPGCGAPQNPDPAVPAYRYSPFPQPVQPYATGGLMAWSIITLLLCTIPGIVAIVQTSGINKCTSVEEQQKKISSAKTWCTVGTILGILAFIGAIAGNM